MEDLTLLLSAILGLCLLFYGLVAFMRSATGGGHRRVIRGARRVLLVTAHPDDETMFFAPTVLNLTKKKDSEVFLLCLSRGDTNKLKGVRKRELYKACEVLGIPEGNITVLNYTKLRDDPMVRWREELVSEVVLQAVVSNNIDVVVTFDRWGVSGHKNHTSIYNAMTLLSLEKKFPRQTRVFCLRTVNLLRKYSLLLDVPMSFLLAPVAYVSSPNDWLAIQRAMARHSSQYVWFRMLYMTFSRYVLINTYDQLGGGGGEKKRK